MRKPLLQPFGRLALWAGLLTGTLHAGGTALDYLSLPFLSAASPAGESASAARVELRRPAAVAALAPPATDADLATTLSSPAQAPQGSLVYFEATVVNNGPQNQTSITTTIQLPTGLTGVSLSNSGSYNATNGQATFPAFSLNNGATAKRNIAFTMPGTRVDASATSVSSKTDITDPNAGNNTGTSSTGPTQVADIEMVINGPTRVVPNQAIVYTVVATNLGPSTATGVSLQAKIPSGRTGVTLSNGGSYNRNSGVVTWPAVATLNSGANIAYTVRFNAGATTGTVEASTSATSTTSGGDPVVANNDGTNVRAQITTQIVSSLATQLCANPGGNGTQSINSSPNTYYPGVGSALAGSTTVALGTKRNEGNAGVDIAKGDLVVIMQMQGAAINTEDTDAYGDGIGGDGLGSGNEVDANFTAGRYEYVVAEGYSGGTLTLRNPLIYDYKSANATATQGQQRFQVLRVPQYAGLTLNQDILTPRWNGSTGGVMVFDVNGALNFNGKTINARGQGFRGGAGQVYTGGSGVSITSYRHSNTITTSGNKGEGTAGTPRYLNDGGTLLDNGGGDGYPAGDRGRGGPGNAGGGGTDGQPSVNDENTGGGGGGNAGRGGQGGNAWNSNRPTGGNGGADFTQATPSRIVMGGGGGSGTTNNGTGSPVNGFASSGAAGGGIVLIRATSVSGTGTIDVSGADMEYVPANDGSGGGGAGGSVVLLVNSANNNPNSTVLQNITVLANGGKGGSNTGGGSPHGPGGGGGGGIIFASSTLNSATRSDPGANGTTFGFAQYGSGVGAADLGQAQTGITRADVPNIIIGCPADVQTTLTTDLTQAKPGTTVTFTISTQNNGPSGTAVDVVRTITLVPNLAATDLTLPADASYNPTTGVVTLATIASLAPPAAGATPTPVTATISFKMPAQTVLGTARSTSTTDDPATGNNDGTADVANVQVVALTQISGRIYDDVNYGGGTGRNYAAAEASATASGIAQIGSAGTRVELYDGTGNNAVLLKATITGVGGSYGFDDIPSDKQYTVRVVNSTVKSARTPDATGVLPIMTFRVNNGAANPGRVGGENPSLVDAGAASNGATLGSLTAGEVTAQSFAVTPKLTSTPYQNADFGFNFSTITNTRSTGQGSLRQFIINANALGKLGLDQDASSNGGDDPAPGTEKSIFMISDGKVHPGLNTRATQDNQLTTVNGQQVARIVLNTAADGALPALTASKVIIDGTTQTLNVGNTNTTALGAGSPVGTAGTGLSKVDGPEVELVGSPSQNNSQRGLTLANFGQGVKGLAIYGFGSTTSNIDGADIYVTADATSGTLITGNVLGASATSFTDPGTNARSTGNGVLFDNISTPNGVQVAATVSNNLVGFHGAGGISLRAYGSPTALLIEDNEVRGNAQTLSTAAAVLLSRNGGIVSGNLIADNRAAGISTQGSDGGATITGNTVASNGLSTVQTSGVRLGGTNNLVNQNVISGNYGSGVMALTTAVVNRISQNSIFGNGGNGMAGTSAASAGPGIGIDLLSSVNNPDDQAGNAPYVTKNADSKPAGGNALLNFPIITRAALPVVSNNRLQVIGYAPADAQVEFFISDKDVPAFGQGKTYLFTATEGSTGDTNSGTGNYSGLVNGLDQGTQVGARKYAFEFNISSLPAEVQTLLKSGTARITATATVRTGQNFATSEFSGNEVVRVNEPLPVTLVSFTARAAGTDALLNWRTAAELNNSYFAVERSLDGQRFEEVGRRAGQGTSSQPHAYALTDAGIGQQAAGRLVYYRLRQVDLDGTASYSQVQTVRFGAAPGVAVWPTPTSADAMLQLGSLPAGTYQVLVHDATGRLVHRTTAAGGKPLPLPSASWPRGTYMVRVTGAGSTHVTQLVKY